MSEFVRPDCIYQVQIINAELLLSPSHDFIHHFRRNGAYILKYIDLESDPPRMSNIPMTEENALALSKGCNLEIVEREYFGQQEYDHYMAFMDSQLDRLDFTVDE